MSLVSMTGAQTKHQTAHQQGLALIEVLLSLGLSSMMFLVLFTAQTHSQKVLTYSGQLHYANGLLDQVATQVWAYPHHYDGLISDSLMLERGCLKGNQCNLVEMTQAWATHWQQSLRLHLPSAQLNIECDGACAQGNSLTISLTWIQSLAVFNDQCEKGMACIYLDIVL